MEVHDFKTIHYHGQTLVPLREVAKVLGVTEKTLNAKLKAGVLDSILDPVRCALPPHRAYGIPVGQLLAFVGNAGEGGPREQ